MHRAKPKLGCRGHHAERLICIPPAFSILLFLQVITPLALTFLVLVLAAAIALWTSASGGLVIWTMLSSVGLMGATTALLQGGLFGLAGLCPPIYVQVCAAVPHTQHVMLEARSGSIGDAG